MVWVLARAGEQLRTAAIFRVGGGSVREQSALFGKLLSLRRVRRCCIDAGGLGMQLGEEAVEQYGEHRVEAVVFTAGSSRNWRGDCGSRWKDGA